MNFRKATKLDIDAIEKIYDEIHDEEESGAAAIGWIKGVYPTRQTAEAALLRRDLFVCEDGGEVLAAAIINKIQVDVYADCKWQYEASDDEVGVLHTLVVSPKAAGRGVGTKFVGYYEACSGANGCKVLRMDTNEKNKAARSLYKKLGYTESGIVPCVFNGIPNVNLVLLEKSLY